MKTFLQWLAEDTEDLTGIYPPGYGGIGNYPLSYFSRSNPYIKASKNSLKKKKKKHKKKKKD